MSDERRLDISSRMFDKYSEFLKMAGGAQIRPSKPLHEAWQEFCRVSSQSERNIEFALSEILKVFSSVPADGFS